MNLSLFGIVAGMALVTSAQADGFKRLDESCSEGKSAFAMTVYPKIVRDCALCHKPDSIGPAFVLPTAEAAYFRVKNYVDTVDLSRSALLIRAGNNHCGKVNCNETSGAEMKTLMDKWYTDGEKDCSPAGKYFTQQLPIPADVPTSRTEWKKVTWDLASIQDDFDGTVFSAEIQQFTAPTPEAPGSYRVRKPRIESGFDAVRVKGLHIYVNGKYDRLANAYETVDQVVAPQESIEGVNQPYPLLSTSTTIFIQESTADKISIAFDDLTMDRRPDCQELALFKSGVMPAMAECTSCHAPNGATPIPKAMNLFSMNLTDRALCSAVKQRTPMVTPFRSVVTELASRGKLEHPIMAAPLALLEAMKTWWSAERSH